jgi:Leucine-rich repeat (LRR) protein
VSHAPAAHSRSGSRSSLQKPTAAPGAFSAKAASLRDNTLSNTGSAASISSLPPSRSLPPSQSSSAATGTSTSQPLTVQLLAPAIEASGSEFIADVSNKNIGSLGKALESFPTLRSLNLSFNALTSLRGIEAAVDLRELKAYGNHIASLQGIEKCKKLERLLLNSNDLTESAINAGAGGGISECKFLKQLRLDHNRLSATTGLAGLFDKCLSLQDLDISDNYDIRSLNGLKLRMLMTLRASGNAISDVAILHLVGVPALEELHLDRNRITSVAGLAPLSKLMVSFRFIFAQALRSMT